MMLIRLAAEYVHVPFADHTLYPVTKLWNKSLGLDYVTTSDVLVSTHHSDPDVSKC